MNDPQQSAGGGGITVAVPAGQDRDLHRLFEVAPAVEKGKNRRAGVDGGLDPVVIAAETLGALVSVVESPPGGSPIERTIVGVLQVPIPHVPDHRGRAAAGRNCLQALGDQFDHVGLEKGIRIHRGVELGCMDGEPFVGDAPEPAGQTDRNLGHSRGNRSERLRADLGVEGVPVLIIGATARVGRRVAVEHQTPGLPVGHIDPIASHVFEPIVSDVKRIAVEPMGHQGVQGQVLDVGVVVGVPDLLDLPGNGLVRIGQRAAIESFTCPAGGIADQLAQPHSPHPVEQLEGRDRTISPRDRTFEAGNQECGKHNHVLAVQTNPHDHPSQLPLLYPFSGENPSGFRLGFPWVVPDSIPQPVNTCPIKTR